MDIMGIELYLNYKNDAQNQKDPINTKFIRSVVAGAGLEPTTFGL